MGIKWLVIPAALAAAGYYYIGPELGAPRTEPVVIKSPETNTAPAPKARRFKSEPEVEVTVRRGAPPPKKRRKRRTTTPAATPTTESAAPATSAATDGGQADG